MFNNERQFWFWWTKSMRDWFEEKFEALASSISSAMPEEATEQDIDNIFTSSES